jgi:segregation and condensation protein A
LNLPAENPDTPAPVETPVEDKANYTVHLEDFEGPLDLLLYLIQRDEFDIYDIPIAKITEAYVAHIEAMDVFSLDSAGEFLVMAATLMRIKARMLLPVQRSEDGEEDEADPRDELVRRLLEYKKYKEASEQFAEQEEMRRQLFTRGISYPFEDEDKTPPELSLTMVDLLHAVRNVLDEMHTQDTHCVYTEVYTVDGQEALILERLQSNDRMRFAEIFEGMSVKMEVVVSFVALLDLLKQRKIQVQQSAIYGEMWILVGDGLMENLDEEQTIEEETTEMTDEA